MSESHPSLEAIGAPRPEKAGHGFGTMPVFLAAISTILGAIMFLRFGYAVGNVGLAGTLAIILLGHMVTVPTALALAEIATNRKVEGGGEYFIISRSFGTTIGSVIGISLFLSQAVSVAFYMLAFAEAFQPLAHYVERFTPFLFEPRLVTVPATIVLVWVMLSRGADMGVKALYVVVATLVASLALFFLGGPVPGFDPDVLDPWATVSDPDPFFLVFSICFPAFTGMTAGVGLSGDLANPRQSIPAGTLSATVVGAVVYMLLVVKLAMSAPPDLLASDQLVMSRVALWGPIIPLGLACATLSSAIGSILVAPRTLQALGGDGSLPWNRANAWLARGAGEANEPRNATLVTGALALVIAAAGNVDAVARLISMFFMVTYGSLCAISFLEHVAARPGYRPSFRSRWYVSLFGAGMCLFMMMQMDPVYAILAILLMFGLYRLTLRFRKDTDDVAEMFHGVMTQLTRHMQVQIQRGRDEGERGEWRPSVIMVNSRTFDRRSPLTLLRWICHRHGFGTYLHFIRGPLDREHYLESLRVKEKLIQMARQQRSAVFMGTIISPSLISALAQSLQLPGVSGLNNNTVMFEFSVHDGPEAAVEVARSCLFSSSTDMGLLVLRHGDHYFGERASIHLWLTWNDRDNANLMVLLAYILLGNPDWANAEIRVFAAHPTGTASEHQARLEELLAEGRLPISEKNVEHLRVDDVESYRRLVRQRSGEADLTILGFDLESLEERQEKVFLSHPQLKDVLFVYSREGVSIG